jgi:hypothetical protein
MKNIQSREMSQMLENIELTYYNKQLQQQQTIFPHSLSLIYTIIEKSPTIKANKQGSNNKKVEKRKVTTKYLIINPFQSKN